MRGETITYRLQVLLQFRVQSTGLEGNDLGSSIGVMGNGGAALGAEKAMDVFPRGAFAGPFLDGAFDGELVFGDDGDEGCSLVSEGFKTGDCAEGRRENGGSVSGLIVGIGTYSRWNHSGAGSHRSGRSP